VYGSAAESLSGQPAEVQDEGWNRMTTAPGLLFSGTLKATDWPRLKIFHDDLVHFVPELKSRVAKLGLPPDSSANRHWANL
jgi:hypothetical protein